MTITKFKTEIIALTLSISVACAISLPSVRNFIYEQNLSSERKVLASVTGDLTGNGDLVTVVKVKSLNSISLEIVLHRSDESQVKDIRRIVLDNKRDTYFDLKDSVTNLALMDLNNDGILEIITSTSDEELIPRLHIYSYSPEDENFIKLGPESISSL